MDDRELAMQFLASMEELYLRVVVQQALLDIWDPEGWRERVEDAEILHSPQIHAVFDKLRAGLFGDQQASPPPADWQEIVRNLLDDQKHG